MRAASVGLASSGSVLPHAGRKHAAMAITSMMDKALTVPVFIFYLVSYLTDDPQKQELLCSQAPVCIELSDVFLGIHVFSS